MGKTVFTKSDNFKSEYSCAVVKINELTPIEGSDFLAKTLVFGTQIVVRKDQVKEGDIMLYAANETQLNEDFLSVNNLFEIGCREKNANADEVNKIMAPYMVIKAKADKLKNDAKQVKGAMDSLTKKAAKINKENRKKEKTLESYNPTSEEYLALKGEIAEAQAKADDYLAKATAKTTVYTNLKKEAEDLIKSGADIVAEAKKHVGFFNKYGRVRCLTLKNTPSFGFLFGVNELIKFDSTITMEDVEAYIGQEFDTVNDVLFVKVYVPPIPQEQVHKGNKNKAQNKIKRFDRMIDGEFFFHYNTTQLQKTIGLFRPDDVISVSVKLHGTSSIIGKVHVKQQIKLPFLKHWFNKFVDATGLFKNKRITDYEIVYGPVYSSRTVIKNRYINQDVNGGYYKADVWTEYGDIIYPYLDDGMTIYGEICGYITGTETPIQKLYDYGCDKGQNFIMLYRITTTNEDGSKREWEVPEVLEWTNKLIERMKENGDENWKKIHPIDLLYHGTLEDLYPELDTENHWHENVLEAMKNDKEHFKMEMNEPLCTFNEVPREGVCVRKFEDKILECFKLKTVSFGLREALLVDSGEVDIEMAEGYTDDDTTSENASEEA